MCFDISVCFPTFWCIYLDIKIWLHLCRPISIIFFDRWISIHLSIPKGTKASLALWLLLVQWVRDVKNEKERAEEESGFISLVPFFQGCLQQPQPQLSSSYSPSLDSSLGSRSCLTGMQSSAFSCAALWFLWTKHIFVNSPFLNSELS